MSDVWIGKINGLDDRRFTPTTQWVIRHLANFAGDEGTVKTTYAEMLARSGKSRSAVQASIKQLFKFGYITQWGEGPQSYQLHVPPVEVIDDVPVDKPSPSVVSSREVAPVAVASEQPPDLDPPAQPAADDDTPDEYVNKSPSPWDEGDEVEYVGRYRGDDVPEWLVILRQIPGWKSRHSMYEMQLLRWVATDDARYRNRKTGRRAPGRGPYPHERLVGAAEALRDNLLMHPAAYHPRYAQVWMQYVRRGWASVEQAPSLEADHDRNRARYEAWRASRENASVTA